MIDNNLLQTQWDAIIIGGVAAGASAALGLHGKRVLMLDVGIRPPSNPLPDEPLYSLREQRNDLHTILLGANGESMAPIAGEDISPKLKSPFIRFITERPRSVLPDSESGFKAVQSFALGGLANAWGAGVMRYNEDDLRGFPFSTSDLAPLYDELTDHIGINGETSDDLTEYLGSTYGLQQPFPLSPLVASFLERYEARRASMRRMGVRVGRPRMAILSKPHRGRRPYRAFGHDFVWGPQEAIYSPLFTIEELISSGALSYQPNLLVSHYSEHSEGVSVWASDVNTGQQQRFSARRLIVAAGAINSARIVLASHNDTTTRLPLLDNAVSFIPAVDISKIGSPLQTRAYIGAELLFLFPGESKERPLQGSVYGLMGPLRTDLLREFPLSLRGNMTACRYLVPGLLMVQMFYPDEQNSLSWLKRNQDGTLDIHRGGRLVRDREGDICKALRKMGYIAFGALCVRPGAGSSIHYAGTLPMHTCPSHHYMTTPQGRLANSQRIYIADAATFPSLPAKNHTFTLMANALRIAKFVKGTL